MVSMKRAQAAMEYLMTYGWALLVIVLVLGALIYLGVLNPQGRMQDMCNLPIGFGCEVAGLTQDGDLSLRITNQQATQLTDMELICKTSVDDNFDGSPSDRKRLNPGQSEIFTCGLESVDGRSLGDFVNGDIRLSHDSGITDSPKVVTGTFSAKVSIESTSP